MKKKSIKIAIDVSPIVYGTGVSVYTKNLVKHLLKVDKDNEYLLFGGSFRRKDELKKFLTGLEGSYTYKIFDIPPTLADIMWNRFGIIGIERLIGNVDVFHSSDWAQPPSKAFNVTTVHDLTPILFPGETHPKIRSVHSRRIEKVKRLVDRIIVPSNASKNDLLNIGFEDNKIRVIPEAVELDTIGVDDVSSVKTKARVKGEYLLAVGTSKRKNINNIIAAFEKIKAETKVKNLVIVGHSSHNINKFKGVRYLGYVTNEELGALYFGSSALVYASLYEGFGLPILEAFKYGSPVVASNVSSMPEVAGRAAIYVNPNDIDSIAEGIKDALKNKKELIGEGQRRLRKYSWEKTAKMTLEVYKEALA